MLPNKLACAWIDCFAPPSIPGTACATSPATSRHFVRSWQCSSWPVPFAFLITEHAWKRFVLISVMLVVPVVELLNTALEKLADRVSRKSDGEICRVKDMSSAAVGLSLVMAVLAWLLALAERISVVSSQ